MFFLLQVPMPEPGQDPWPWVAFICVVAVGALFLKYDSTKDARIARSEKREDTLLENSTTSTAIMKQQSEATLTAAGIAEQAFEMGKNTHSLVVSSAERADRNHKEQCDKLDRIIDLLEHGDRPPPSAPRRRT